MTENGKPDVLGKIRSVLREGGSRRSPVSQWFLDNHDEFAALVEDRRPNWDMLAEKFREGGLVDTKGKSPSGDRLRVTWWRVQKEHAKRAARKARKASVQRGGDASLVGPSLDTLPDAREPDRPAPSAEGESAHDALARMRAELNRRSSRK